jgi:hypothetical protein
MEPLTLTVMAFLTPFLTKAGEEFASNIGKEAFEQCKRLYDAVRARFAKEAPKDGGNAVQALDALAKDPDMASAVQAKLDRILQADPDFANTLEQILHSGPLQDIQIGEDSTAEGNQMRNREGEGSQTMHGGNRSTLKDNVMEIG